MIHVRFHVVCKFEFDKFDHEQIKGFHQVRAFILTQVLPEVDVCWVFKHVADQFKQLWTIGPVHVNSGALELVWTVKELMFGCTNRNDGNFCFLLLSCLGTVIVIISCSGDSHFAAGVSEFVHLKVVKKGDDGIASAGFSHVFLDNLRCNSCSFWLRDESEPFVEATVDFTAEECSQLHA